MDASRISRTLLACCFILSSQVFCLAQKQLSPHQGKNNFYLNGTITLDSLTRYVHRKSGMRFSFNSSKVNGSKVINFPPGNYSFSMLLRRLQKTTSLSFTIYKGYVIFSDHPALPNHPTSRNRQQIPANTQKGDSSSLKYFTQIAPSNPPSAVQLPSAPPAAASPNSIPPASVPSAVARLNTVPPAAANHKDNLAPAAAGGGLRIKNLHLNLGLQWNMSLPVYGTKNYFTGTNGNNQAYNILIPGLWISRSWENKHEILLQVKPVLNYFTGSKVLTDSSGPEGPIDSSYVQKTRVLIKTSGAAAGLQYNYSFDDKWSVGISLEYHLQFSALVAYKTIKQSTGAVLADSIAGINKSSTDWQYIKSSFIAGSVGLAYRLNKFQAGAALVIPVTSPAASTGAQIRPLNGILFFRWWIR